jgi:hypothetical protein
MRFLKLFGVVVGIGQLAVRVAILGMTPDTLRATPSSI